MAAWWARVDKYHSKHWLTRLLSTSPWHAVADVAPGAALRQLPEARASLEAVRQVREAAAASGDEDCARVAEWLRPLQEGSGSIAEVSCISRTHIAVLTFWGPTR